MGNVKKFLDAIQIFDTPHKKIRIGNEKDGGYVALEELCGLPEVVYSFGVGQDVGFELDYVKRYPHVKFELYDPTIEKLPVEHRRFTLHRLGIGLDCKPLEGVDYDALLKMDVEWSEWSALLTFDPDQLKKFSQILIEFHIVHAEPRMGLTPYFQEFYKTILGRVNQDLFAMYYEVMEKLSNHFVAFHIHANNSLPPIQVNGYCIPPLLELSFVRKDCILGKITPSTGPFPVAGLDFPNKDDRPDIINYYPWRERC